MVECGWREGLQTHTHTVAVGAINYLKRAERVRLADIGVLVPAAVRVLHAAEAAVVAPIAHGQIDLLDAVVGGHVQ